MDTTGFYKDLASFGDFSGIAEIEQYTQFPDDWVVFVTDIVNSTLAVRDGKYKDVNMAGAASIMAALNCAGTNEIPFAFGGDGAMVVVPGGIANEVRAAMAKLCAYCQSMFGLELRASAILIADLKQMNAPILVRKLRLLKGNDLAMFSGAGVNAAEQLLKENSADADAYRIAVDTSHAPDLDGLSCRWEALPSSNGVMLTLIIVPVGGDEFAKLHRVDTALRELLQGNIEGYRPANRDTMRFRFPPASLMREFRAQQAKGKPLRRLGWIIFTSAMQYLCERFGIKIGDYDGKTYRDELVLCTDFRKFDGALRMVLDVSPKLADTIEEFLADEYAQKRLVYGTAKSNSALMTCMLFDLANSQHLHLIDGAEGGYTLASIPLKKRMQEARLLMS